MTYMVSVLDSGVEKLDHHAGDYKAAFDLSRTFGRDALREIIEKMGLVESETLIDGRRYKVFHNDDVAISMTKDPWQDYPTDSNGDKVKNPVHREEWGGRHNPLKPARTGYVHVIGTQSEVMTFYNLFSWRSFNKGESLGYWGY